MVLLFIAFFCTILSKVIFLHFLLVANLSFTAFFTALLVKSNLQTKILKKEIKNVFTANIGCIRRDNITRKKKGNIYYIIAFVSHFINDCQCKL